MSHYLHILYENIKKAALEKKNFISFEGKGFSYKELLSDLQKLTHLFHSYGFVQGDRLIITTTNDRYTASIFIAALLNGLCPVVLPSDIKIFRLNRILAQVKPRVLFIDEGVNTGVAAVPHTILLKEISLWARVLSFVDRSKRQVRLFPTLLDRFTKLNPSCGVDLHASAYILYTSSSTASPKGVEHSHRSLFTHLCTLQRVYSYDAQSILCNAIDLSHSDGLVHGLLITAFCGASLIRPRPFSLPYLEYQLEAIYNNKVTHFITLPAVLAWIDKFTQENNYFSHANFKMVISVAGKLGESLWRRLNTRFSLSICNMYGLTESVSGAIFCGPEPKTYQLGTIGRPIDLDIAVLTENGICRSGYGELLIKGYSLFKGYYKNPEATLNAFFNGWFRTGDLAQIETTGFVKLIGRSKATLITGGRTVEPEEIDEVLQLYPSVLDSQTFGLPDAMMGQVIVSAIESTRPIDEVDLIQYCLTKLEVYKVPKKIYFIKCFPRGRSGKVLQTELASLVQTLDAKKIRIEKKTELVEADIIDIAAKSFKLPVSQLSMDAESDLIALWDPLGHLNFMMELENHYEIKIEGQEIMTVGNLKQAKELVQSKL